MTMLSLQSAYQDLFEAEDYVNQDQLRVLKSLLEEATVILQKASKTSFLQTLRNMLPGSTLEQIREIDNKIQRTVQMIQFQLQAKQCQRKKTQYSESSDNNDKENKGGARGLKKRKYNEVEAKNDMQDVMFDPTLKMRDEAQDGDQNENNQKEAFHLRLISSERDVRKAAQKMNIQYLRAYWDNPEITVTRLMFAEFPIEDVMMGPTLDMNQMLFNQPRNDSRDKIRRGKMKLSSSNNSSSNIIGKQIKNQNHSSNEQYNERQYLSVNQPKRGSGDSFKKHQKSKDSNMQHSSRNNQQSKEQRDKQQEIIVTEFVYKYDIEDLSSNGTYLNGDRMEKGKRIDIGPGDEIGMVVIKDSQNEASSIASSADSPTVSGRPFRKERIARLQSKDKEAGEAILVHIVPHSYNTEFMNTVNEYFPGRKEDLMQIHFNKVFDAVISSMLKEPHRTFTHYEVKYFSNWYKNQSEEVKRNVKLLVQLGTLEFVNGGWETHDNVCPHYSDMLLNLHRGHQFLVSEFGVHPRVAWNLDPYGHSDANARLLAESGIEALYFKSVDPQDRENRLASKTMETLWRPSFWHLGRKAEIFTHVMYDFEISPFDLIIDGHKKVEPTTEPSQQPTQIQQQNATNSESTDNNQQPQPQPQPDPEPEPTEGEQTEAPTQRRVRKHKLGLEGQSLDTKGLREYAKEVSRFYRTKHVLMFIGAKLNFEDGDIYFDQLDDLITEFNKNNDQVQLTHSTLSFYDETIQAHDFEFPVNYYDLLPLTDNGIRYFTGLYTTRPNLKAIIRRASQELHASNKLFALRMIDSGLHNDTSYQNYLNHSINLQEKVAEAQKTEAIGGVSKDERVIDIIDKLQDALDENNKLTTRIIADTAYKIAGIQIKQNQIWNWCVKAGASFFDCPIGRHQKNDSLNMVVAVFNPSTKRLNHTKIAVPHGNLTVKVFNETSANFEPTNATVLCDLLNNGKNDCWLYAKHQVDAMQFGFIQITYNAKGNLTAQKQYDQNFKIENKYQFLQFKGKDEQYGALFMLQKKLYLQNYHFGFDLRYYPAYQGFDGSRSGATIFRPAGNHSLRYSNLSYHYYQIGSVVSQVTLEYFDNKTKESATVKVQIYPDDMMIEWDVVLDEIPRTEVGKEVTINFHATEITNSQTFFTDVNGLQMIERHLNYRSQWMYQASSHQNISVNYYPIASAIAVRDLAYGSTQMTIMTSRTQGGSVIVNSRIELMHNRRLYYDDKQSKGIIIGDEGSPVQSTYYIQFFDRNYEGCEQRKKQLHIDAPPQYYFAFDYEMKSKDIKQFSQPLLNSTELSETGLPETSKVELFPLDKSKILLRIENLDDQFSHKFAIKQKNYPFVNVEKIALKLLEKVTGRLPNSYSLQIEEMNLSGNEDLKQMNWEKVKWQGTDDDYVDTSYLPIDWNQTYVSLEAQRIRTFVLDYTYKAPPPTTTTTTTKTTTTTTKTTTTTTKPTTTTTKPTTTTTKPTTTTTKVTATQKTKQRPPLQVKEPTLTAAPAKIDIIE
ncbi:glycosyl hydrolases family 38 protein [Stylonychia lemnae]|uniref:Glycosyl hydrolases family 38 protein n=1 Tax=Stylonychia lemnae TaxID=5949 RepID=A0A078AW64_STYLE|nr:glycosyl hydrolases family 38 protein [Stylonychia lemnae]|eukprot:CDW86710.1 glycosyl hydrolases family 38 protein [Stylonychia lemnae]